MAGGRVMKKFSAVLIGAAIGGLLGLGINWGLTIPEVQMSYSTGECVKVINYDEDTKYSCENLPSKYHHVWVQ